MYNPKRSPFDEHDQDDDKMHDICWLSIRPASQVE